MDEQKKLKSELLRAKLRGEVTQSDYAQANADFDAEVSDISKELRAVQTQGVTLDAFLTFAKLMLVDVAEAWQLANIEQRVRVQNFLFQAGIPYKQNKKFLNTSKPTLFQQLRALTRPETIVGVPGGI